MDNIKKLVGDKSMFKTRWILKNNPNKRYWLVKKTMTHVYIRWVGYGSARKDLSIKYTIKDFIDNFEVFKLGLLD
jgi:hypothetical protein